MSLNTSDINTVLQNTENQTVLQKLQAIRLWQLLQQEELKKQQQSQLALLKAQSLTPTAPENGESAKNKYNIDDLSVHSNDEEEELAFPLGDLTPMRLDTILEQCSVMEISEDKDAIGNVSEVQVYNETPEVVIKSQFQTDKGENKDEIVENDASMSQENDLFVVDYNASEDLHYGIEKSFEEVSSKTTHFDEVPIKTGKTFEQLLEEQLQVDQQEPNFVKPQEKQQAVSSTPKRTYLKRGQGIARFKGPPPKPKIKKKALKSSSNVSDGNFDFNEIKVAKPPPNFASNEHRCQSPPIPVGIKESCTKPVACVRKTARIARKSRNMELKLIAEPANYDTVKDEHSINNEHDSIWSDAENSILLNLETTLQDNEIDKTSNETFEQIERYCNENYGNITTKFSLDDTISIQHDNHKSPPLPNKLMQSLFPNLSNIKKDMKDIHSKVVSTTKPEAKIEENPVNVRVKKPLEPVIEAEEQCSITDQSSLLKSKLEEIEKEIKKFQEESVKLEDARHKQEEQLHILKEEFEEFQQQRQEEIKRFDEFKKSEIKKLKKDRKIFDDMVAARKSLPNKQDREQIRELENKISVLQDNYKSKEERLAAAHNRLRTQVEVLTKETTKLTTENKMFKDKIGQYEIESKKNRKASTVWNSINNIVDSIPLDENDSDIENCSPSTPPKRTVTSWLKPKLSAPKPSPKHTGLKSKPNLPLPKSNLNARKNNIFDKNDNKFNDHVTVHDDGKVERRLSDGSLEISFRNGTQKQVLLDGTIQIKFANGDVKTTYTDGTVMYMYTSSGTKHTTHTNGMQVIEFANNQIERHFPDGSKHISFDDGSSKMLKLDGTEETIFLDGTILIVKPHGEKRIEFANGQLEVHTDTYKRREYPDGTCKTVYTDGKQETRYASGRLRIKNGDGDVIIDRMTTPPANIISL